nr:DNA relaxase/nickase TraS/VirD2-like protein [uncultured bacterium]
MREIDGVLRDWGEVASKSAAKPSKGRNIAGGKYKKPAKTPHISAMAAREKLAATVRKAPEVMVKISGGGKDMRGIKAHFDYISRNGEVEIEDEQGRIHQGKEEVRDVRDDWKGGGIPYESGTKREAFNIVLSMPPGTDRAAVKDAAREFASELFSNHQYVFAAHDDEKHPHIHLAVKAVDLDGVRMNPRKADLQQWRETFAEKLRGQGIEANATPRQLRGVVKKAEKQSVKHINRRHREGKGGELARVTQSQQKAVEREVKEGQKHINPAQDNISAGRKQVQQGYGAVARALAAGTAEDKQLALEVVQFVQQMPPVETRHAEQVEAVKRGMAREQSRAVQKDQGREGQQKDQGRSR